MKPSPIVSILLFVGTVTLAFSLFGRGWRESKTDLMSARSGPVWSSVCFKRYDADDAEVYCETTTFLSHLDEGKWGFERVSGLLFVLFGLAGTVVAGIAGIVLLRKARSVLSVLALSFVGASLLFVIGIIVYLLTGPHPQDVVLPGYGLYIFLVGAVVTIIASIMGMARAKHA